MYKYGPSTIARFGFVFIPKFGLVTGLHGAGANTIETVVETGRAIDWSNDGPSPVNI